MPEHDRIWRDSVKEAITRVIRRAGTPIFTRAELIKQELNTIIKETASQGKTPEDTLSRVLQELRDAGEIDFLQKRGTYQALF